jgi:hypothetical protein
MAVLVMSASQNEPTVVPAGMSNVRVHVVDELEPFVMVYLPPNPVSQADSKVKLAVTVPAADAIVMPMPAVRATAPAARPARRRIERFCMREH